jgi:hypothetical protein
VAQRQGFCWAARSTRISLLVGGIRIMDIMLASVAERTRETGVRRALEDRRRDVAAQFLVESSLLTVAGRVLGSVLGLFGAALIQAFAGWPTAVHPLMADGPFDLRARRAIALLTPAERPFRPTGEPARRGLYARGRRLPRCYPGRRQASARRTPSVR